MKGDRVEIVVDAGGTSRTYDVRATRAGRRVEVNYGRSVVEITEVTRGGTPVRTARFMATRVLALIEYPATEAPATELSAAKAPATELSATETLPAEAPRAETPRDETPGPSMTS